MKIPCLLALLTWTTFAAAQESPTVTVHCTSETERQHCAADTHAGILLIRSTGPASCLLGRTWGYDAEGVWVTEGCGGEFLVAGMDQGSVEQSPDSVAPAVPESAPRSEGDTDFSFYARFGSIMSTTGDEIDVQDNGSRLAFEFSTGDQIRFFAKGEWSVNLTGARTDFNPGESTSSGFVTLDSVSDRVLGARLGYVGLDFGDMGTLTLGKQWSVHYDIAGYTDSFNTFGAEASATFNAGTDGGLTGTGRADGALIYRNTLFDMLDIGLQTQFRSLANDQVADGYGASLRLRPVERFEAGLSYTRARLSTELRRTVLGLDDDPEYWIAGARYAGESLTIAAIYSQQHNGDLVRIPLQEGGVSFDLPEVFDADGVEVFTRYQIGDVGLLAGLLNYEPNLDTDNLFVDPEARLRYYIAGVDYLPTPRIRLYAEYRFADGIDALGERGDDVFVLGAKYEFFADGLGN